LFEKRGQRRQVFILVLSAAVRISFLSKGVCIVIITDVRISFLSRRRLALFCFRLGTLVCVESAVVIIIVAAHELVIMPVTSEVVVLTKIMMMLLKPSFVFQIHG
jgi:hypothetical protein